MMKLLSIVALVYVVIAATVVITKHSNDILAAFTSWTDSSAQVVQSSTQRARNISTKSPLTFCPIYADSQHSLKTESGASLMYRTTSWGVPGSTELALGFDRSGSPWVNAIPHVVEAMATSATANVAVIRSLRPGRHIRWRELGTQRLVDDGLSDYPEAGSS